MSTSSSASAQTSGMANGLTHFPAPTVAATAAALAETGTVPKPRTRPKNVATPVRRMTTRTFSLSGITTTTASLDVLRSEERRVGRAAVAGDVSDEGIRQTDH